MCSGVQDLGVGAFQMEEKLLTCSSNWCEGHLCLQVLLMLQESAVLREDAGVGDGEQWIGSCGNRLQWVTGTVV